MRSYGCRCGACAIGRLRFGRRLGQRGGVLAGVLRREDRPHHRIALIDAFLRDGLPCPDDRLDALARVVREMLDAPEPSVDEFAARYGTSRRTLERASSSVRRRDARVGAAPPEAPARGEVARRRQ